MENNSMVVDNDGMTDAAGDIVSRRPSRSCLLCDLALNRQHEELAGIIQAFVADHITRTQVEKISQDVLQVLQENLPPEMVRGTTEEDIAVHVNTHTTHPTIIMTQVVRDLTDLASAARETCIMTCEETQMRVVNSKAASVYLKTIGELQTALRHEALRVQNK